MGNAIYYFASPPDLLAVMETVEAETCVQYILAGLHEESAIVEYPAARLIPDVGIARRPDMNHVPRFLVVRSGSHVVVRNVPQHRGGTRYAVDQMANPHSIEFTPGGIYEHLAVISGRIATASKDNSSQELFRQFRNSVRAHFVRHQSYWVGAEAERLARAGRRLTASVSSPRDYDLALAG